MRVAQQRKDTESLFPRGEISAPKTRAESLQGLRALRLRDAEGAAASGPLDRLWQRFFGKLLTSARRQRIERISHNRGYRYGAMIDLERITDWRKFFSLSTEEVARRFFREDAEYDLL